MKIWNQLRYGDSNARPRYVKRKRRWLYKGAWIDDSVAYSVLSGGLYEHSYLYQYSIDGHDYATDDFNEVVEHIAQDYTLFGSFASHELEVLGATVGGSVDRAQKELGAKCDELRTKIDATMRGIYGRL